MWSGPTSPRLPAALALAAAASLAAPPARAEPAYISGGIGQQESELIESRQADYNLHMVFSEGPKNNYVTNVTLRIADSRGRTVLALDDAGPLTNVALPPGRYSVSTRYGPHERIHAIDVKAGTPVDLYLHYPAVRDAGGS